MQPGRRLPISFAISKPLDVGELDDATLIVDLRHDKTDASDDHMFAESLRQEIDVAHTIEHRKDHRFWANRRSEIVHRSLERVGFHTQ